MNTPRLHLTNVALVGQEIALAWEDGSETYLTLETLRRACPCALCQGEADVLGMVERPERIYKEDSFTLRSLHPVGGYALQVRWADGHDTGLYSFSYLRGLPSQQTPFSS